MLTDVILKDSDCTPSQLMTFHRNYLSWGQQGRSQFNPFQLSHHQSPDSPGGTARDISIFNLEGDTLSVSISGWNWYLNKTECRDKMNWLPAQLITTLLLTPAPDRVWSCLPSSQLNSLPIYRLHLRLVRDNRPLGQCLNQLHKLLHIYK